MKTNKKSLRVQLRELQEAYRTALAERDAATNKWSEKAILVDKLQRERDATNEQLQCAERGMAALRAAVMAYALAISHPATAGDAARIAALQGDISGNGCNYITPFR